MRRPTSALAKAFLGIGAALGATTVSAQQPPVTAPPAAPGELVLPPFNPSRGARHLLRNGWDYITYQQYDRALSFFREAESRQAELTVAERTKLKQGIERAQRGLREAANGMTTEPVYARSGRNARPGALALATPPRPLPLDPSKVNEPGIAREPIQLASGDSVPGNAANVRAGGNAPEAPRPAAEPVASAPAVEPVVPVAAEPGPMPPSADSGTVSLPPLSTVNEPLPAAPTENAPLALPAGEPAPLPPPAGEAPALPAPVGNEPAPLPSPEPSTPTTSAPAVEPAPVPAAEPVAPVSNESPQPEPMPQPPTGPLPAVEPAPTTPPPPDLPADPQSETLPQLPNGTAEGASPAAIEPPVTPLPGVSAEADTPPAPMPGGEPSPLPAGSAPIDPPPAAEAPPAEAPSPLDLPRRADIPASTLSPELQREVERIARRQEEELRRNAAQNLPGGDPNMAAPADPAPGTASTRLEISRAPSPTEVRPIRAIPVPEEFVPLPKRDWQPNRKYWAAAATCHMPLYFQDAVLERYGYSMEQRFGPTGRFLSYPVDDPKQSKQRNQIIQPFFSAGLFAAQIALLPYNMLVDPPWEAEYDLGYYRPGDQVPTDVYYLPWHGVGPIGGGPMPGAHGHSHASAPPTPRW